MENTIKDIGDYRKEMLITAEWSEISGDYDDVVAGYMQAGLPGFRPGKSPKGLIERKYRVKIEEDAQSRSAKRIFKEIIAASEFDFAGAAEVLDIIYNKGEILTFKALFSVVPEFDLPDYKAYKPIEGDAEGKEDSLTDYLLANTEVDIPVSMVEYELNFSDENELVEDARKGAEERVKLLLVLKKIAKLEGIEIGKSDIDRRIEDMAVEYEVTTEQLRENIEQNNSMSRIKSFLLAEHTIAYLLE